MSKMFDGKKIRDEILAELAEKVSVMPDKPEMAVFLIGENEVSKKYVELKQKFGERIGAAFELFKYDEKVREEEVIAKIEELNQDQSIDGIMLQIPLPDGLSRDRIISKISPDKDIDGLRYCLGLESSFLPPVIMAIENALNESGADIANSKIAIVGHGFLVGAPLKRYFKEKGIVPTVLDSKSENFQEVIKGSDIVISAVGKAELIRPEMVKEGVVLIDAGTSESNGELKGDISRESYLKSRYYTPVPGGIGPVTVAMLLSNLVQK